MGQESLTTTILADLLFPYMWLEPYAGQLTGSKLGKEYNKAVHCHPVYLTYMQSTSCKMLGWMTHKLESRLPEKYQQPQTCK